jgi:hypothetical protein
MILEKTAGEVRGEHYAPEIEKNRPEKPIITHIPIFDTFV